MIKFRTTFEELRIQAKELMHLINLKTKSVLMDFYSFNKHISVKRTKKSGMTILKEHCSFGMDKRTLLELL